MEAVVIKTSTVNLYASIERACITASNACGRLGDEASKELDEFLKLKKWASDMHQAAITGGNPSLG